MEENIEKNLAKNVSYSEFKKIELKTAKILAAEQIPEKDNLYKIELDLGSEKRTIVSGLRKYYSVEELVGKTIVLVANLEPKKIGGMLSQGMLLAAVDWDSNKVVLVQPDKEISPGKTVE